MNLILSVDLNPTDAAADFAQNVHQHYKQRSQNYRCDRSACIKDEVWCLVAARIKVDVDCIIFLKSKHIDENWLEVDNLHF